VIMMDAEVVSGAGAAAISTGLLLTNIFLVVFVFVIQRGDAKRLRREEKAQRASVRRIQRTTVRAVQARIRAASSLSERSNTMFGHNNPMHTGRHDDHSGIEMHDIGEHEEIPDADEAIADGLSPFELTNVPPNVVEMLHAYSEPGNGGRMSSTSNPILGGLGSMAAPPTNSTGAPPTEVHSDELDLSEHGNERREGPL